MFQDKLQALKDSWCQEVLSQGARPFSALMLIGGRNVRFTAVTRHCFGFYLSFQKHNKIVSM